MNYFILQSALLIAVAYLLGAIIGCWLRKMFRKSASMLHRTSDELPVKATAGAATLAGATVATRLAGGEGEASVEINRGEVQVEEIPVPEPVVDVAPVAVTVPVERETVTFTEPDPIPVVKVPDPKPAPEPVVEAPVPAKVIEEKIETPAVIPEPVIDDLTKIKGVGLPIALELKKVGVTRFEQVARWTDADIADVSSKLGFTGRIERENWMDQAKILLAGNELEFTTHQLSETANRTTSVETLLSTIPGGGDDLKRIIGIGTGLEQQLRGLGITRFAQISAWTPDEVAGVSRRLDISGRIERENWIEQAKKLAT